MVVQVRADAGQIGDDAHAVLAQQCGRPQTRELEDLRRADRTRREQHLTPCSQGLLACVREPHDHARRARRAIARIESEPFDEGAGTDRQVRPLQHRPKERLGCAPAHAAPLIHLKIGVAEIVAAIELRDLRDAALLGGLAPGVENLPAHAPLLDAQLAAAAMELIGAVLIVFGALEHRQHVVPRPAAQALRGPVVVVGLLSAHVDHRVDRRAPAEHFAARVADAAAVQARVGLRYVAPIGARIADRVEIPDRYVDPEVVVLAARLEQQHAWCSNPPTSGWRAHSPPCLRRRRCSRIPALRPHSNGKRPSARRRGG